MEYAVIEVGGKQYKVAAGDVIEIDRLSENNGSVTFDKVLLSVNGENVVLGKPYIDGSSVSAKVLDNLKGKKIRVARFTAKSRHRRVVGFRASLSKIQIEKISIGAVKAATKVSSKTAKTPAKK